MSTEKRSNAESIEIDGTKPHNKIVCLNCGAVCHSKFCPECGQPTSTPPRITHTSLAKTVAMSYARLTPGFWPTLIGLLKAPWKVIADYVNGKRVTYSPPVTMLIQTVLYVTLILTVIKEITGVDFSFIADDSTDDTIYANWIERALAESDVFVCLVTVTPHCTGWLSDLPQTQPATLQFCRIHGGGHLYGQPFHHCGYSVHTDRKTHQRHSFRFGSLCRDEFLFFAHYFQGFPHQIEVGAHAVPVSDDAAHHHRLRHSMRTACNAFLAPADKCVSGSRFYNFLRAITATLFLYSENSTIPLLTVADCPL